jgi:hypothetical protein
VACDPEVLVKHRSLVAGLGALITLLVFSAGPVYANADQEGRQAGTSTSDGSYAQVVGNGFSANPGQCVIYSAVSTDVTSSRQVEAGVVRCNGATLDGTCTDGHAFVERWAGGNNYYCTPGYTFNNNTAYDATTYRTSGTSTTFTGHINGASLNQGGFGLNDDVVATAQAEASGGTTCPSPSRGTFNVWERYNTNTGWHYIGNALLYRVHYGISGAPCWSPTTASSTGAFVVD